MEHESHGYVRPINRHSVLNVNRQLTNKIVGIIFVISFLLWLLAATYGVVAVPIAVPIDSSTKFPFSDFDSASIYITVGFIFLSADFTLIVFIVLRWIPYTTSLILWIFWVPVPIFVGAAIYQPSFWSIYSSIGSIFNCLLMLILLKSEWFHLSEAVLKEACKTMISVPSTIVFALFTYLLSAFVIVMSRAAIIKIVLAGSTFFTMLIILMNYFFGAWTVITIIALSWMTLSGTYAEYYYAEEKGSVSLGTVLKLFGANLRYHIGTAAWYNPLLGGIRALHYVVVLGVHLMIDGASESVICFIVYNIFDPVILRIVFLGGAATSGIKGDNFYNSMAHTMTLFSNQPKGFLSVVKVMELLMGLLSGLVLVLTIFSTASYLGGTYNASTSWQMLIIYIVLLGGTVFVATLATCVTAACYSIVLCLYDEISLSGQAASTDSCIMSPNLQSALNHDGAPSWFRNSCGNCIPDFEDNGGH